MARKLAQVNYDKVPETLAEHPFFGLHLDEEQTTFRDAIWDPEKLIVFCNARAGTGKTTIAVMTAELLYRYHRYDGILYITAPVQEGKIGFLPGSAQEKVSPYSEPFYEAALKANINPYTAIRQESMMNQKEDTAYIDCVSHNYLRGCTFENKVVIIDEAQNYYVDELKKTITRVSDNCKTIVIGHTGQIDLYHNPGNSGFARYVEHFANEPYAQICTLTHNYRGKVSTHADLLA
jgi:phosphate starvation-inducible protein PhoH and related proteins